MYDGARWECLVIAINDQTHMEMHTQTCTHTHTHTHTVKYLFQLQILVNSFDRPLTN